MSKKILRKKLINIRRNNFVDQTISFVHFKKKEIEEKKKEDQFSQKIDELNQETDNLMEEIDKWQM